VSRAQRSAKVVRRIRGTFCHNCVSGRDYYSIMRRWLRPLWVILALLFLLEAWLWDHLEPIVARVVDLIP
jgi:hypothetical protein